MAVSRVQKSETEISQTIRLDEILGRPPTQLEKQRFLEEAVERIIERTQSGVDRNGKQFRQYTKEYAEEKGVSRGDVDLTLFGDMLLSIQGEESGNSVQLKIEGEEAAKAYGHITGFRGHPTIPNGKYKRDFFGLTEDEAQAIAESIRGETPGQVVTRPSLNITQILNQIGFEIGEG